MSAILKSVGNTVLPINEKKKLSFSTIQYQKVFADGTSRIFYQSINDISASESVVEPSKIFPNDDLSLDSQSDSIPKIVVSSQPSQPFRPRGELMSMTHIDPGENDTMESINTQTSSSHVSKRLSSSDLMEKSFALSETDTFSTAEISLRRSSSPSLKISHAIPEPETQQGIQIPDLTHFVVAGEDDTMESINTQNSSSHVSERLSSSNSMEKSFALSENDTFLASEISHRPSSSAFVEISHAISESETQQQGIQIPDLTHCVAAGGDDTLDSISTQNSSSHLTERLSSSNLIEKSFALSETDTFSTAEISLHRSPSPSVGISHAIPEPETQLGIQIPDLADFVVADEDHTLESIDTQNSSSYTLKSLSSSNNIERSFALSKNDTLPTSKISLHRSPSPSVKISHAIPECEMLPSHRILDLSRFAPNGRDETLFPSHNTLPFNYFSQTGPGSIKPSVVSHYFGQAVSVYIQYLRISATRDKILQFSWVLGFKNGATFVATSDSGDEVVVEPENRKMLIIIEKLINTELSKVEKSLDSIVSHRELFQEVEKIFDRIAILTTELLDLWQRYDGYLLSKSENSFRCGFNIDRLKKRALLVIHLDLQKYLNQKLSFHLRAHFDDRLFYTPITRKILDCCRAVDPSVNKGSYLRRVVKSAENFISDYRKQEDRIRCACYHSEKLRAILSAPMPDIDRTTLVGKVVEVLTSAYDEVPLYKHDPNSRKKIRHNSRKNVEKPGKQSS